MRHVAGVYIRSNMASNSTSYGYSKEFYYQLLLVVLSMLSFRLAISMWGHSGERKPPMHGDFEAQRHWMELTSNLPAKQWYVHGPDNDLQYWGLDYPPLTAYHMMIAGKIAKKYNPEMVELGKSHGIETPEVKLFMRLTVLLMDLIIFLPAVVAYFVFGQERRIDEVQVLTSVMVLAAYPGLALIDNGHFQYNNVSLGLMVMATLALTLTYDILGAILFCLALNYKQMELYHALPFFAYLLGRCVKLGLPKGLYKLSALGFVVIATFALIWSPFLTSVESAMAVLQRLFPFNRGLYEDKVANFWCSVSPFIKFKDIIDPQQMAKICMLVTSLFVLPSFIDLLRKPSITKFHFASINSSLIFFMFSFHVHEKSILIAAIPACLVIGKTPFAVIWFLMISVFSMVPLLMKDGLLIPTFVAVCIFWMGSNHFIKPTQNQRPEVVYALQLSFLGAVCLTLATIFMPPPQRFPDIFQLLIAIYSFAHFFMFTIYFHIKQIGGAYEASVWKLLSGFKPSRAHKTSGDKASTVSVDSSTSSVRELRRRK
ncbi:alpha-1,3-glucosyltransferase [Plakobranchus ocellatus]|uniref:Alpha-1,3-glucosyltransferase n=1 Tax=Plakobranchus ocellatus TaxID=259542 RepID=A0AAV4C715_9GAST|nr:alpha-1,3-glucosyltransferase [Plakobranchus ocellatus]